MARPKSGNFGTYKPRYLKGEHENNYYERNDNEKRISIHKQFQLKWGNAYIRQWRQ